MQYINNLEIPDYLFEVISAALTWAISVYSLHIKVAVFNIKLGTTRSGPKFYANSKINKNKR